MRKVLVGSVLTAVLASVATRADTLTWTGAGDGVKWSDAGNWSSDGSHTVPQSGDRVIASVNAQATVTNDIEGLSLPYLELCYNRLLSVKANSVKAYFRGKQITLTGGLNALRTTTTGSGGGDPRLYSYIPFHLTDGTDGGTNRFTIAQRFFNCGTLTGPGVLNVMTLDNQMYDAAGADQRTTGAYFATGSLMYDLSDANGFGSAAVQTAPTVIAGTGSFCRFYSNCAGWLDIRPAKAVNDATVTFTAYQARTFTGRITGDRLVMAYNGSWNWTFDCPVEIPEGPVHASRSADNQGLVFNGAVNIGDFGRYDQV